MAIEHLVTSVEASRLSPCKVHKVSFLNTDAAVQGVSFSKGRLPSGESIYTLRGAVGITSEFDLGGYPFPDGFTIFPSAATVTNIMVQYEDM